MNKPVSVLVLVLLFLPACHRSSPKHLLILDGWWSADYARTHCAMNTGKCASDPVAEVRDFESRFAAAFASDQACTDISLVRLNDPRNITPANAPRAQAPAWWLSITFEVGKSEQEWTMQHSPDKTKESYYGYINSRGTAGNIAHRVCAIVKGSGGSLKD